jgi:hypothetical protein
LLVDVALVFMILLLFVGRGWKRGQGAREEQESYREMLSSLTVLIREMKETAADLEERAERKQVELQRAVAAADERLAALEAAASTPLPVTPVRGGAPARPAQGPAVTTELATSASALPPAAVRKPSPDGGSMDEDERREKYRIALDFARKGWNALEIARHTQLPRGEVELLIKTRGGPLGGGG